LRELFSGRWYNKSTMTNIHPYDLGTGSMRLPPRQSIFGQNNVRVALLLLLLLAFTLRVYRLDYQELRGDEVFGYFFSLRPLADLTPATLALKEPHPIASYVVAHGWLALAGHSEWALRFLSLWWGVLAVALLYRLARRLDLPAAVGLLAALLLVVSPYALWHSQDARMYSMSLALTIASTWCALEWLQRQRWPQAIAYVALSWLALHTHYFSLFVLLAQNAFVLSRALFLPRLRVTLSGWLSWQGLLALLYLPWLTQVSAILGGYSGNGDSPNLLAGLSRALSVFAVGESTPSSQRSGWALLALALLILGALACWRQGANGRRALWLLLLYLSLPLAATWYSAQQRPIFNERYLVAALPPFCLLIAANLFWIFDCRFSIRPHAPTLLVSLSPCFLVLLLLVGTLLSLQRHYSDPAYSKTRGWRELAATLTRFTAELPLAQVRLAQNFPDPTLWYYYSGPVPHLVLPPAAHDGPGSAQVVAQLQTSGVERVILPVQPAPNWDDQQLAARALGQTYALVAETQVGVWPVQVYAHSPAQLERLAVRFDNGLNLTGVGIRPQQLVAGGVLVVTLGWRGDRQMLHGTEKVFVQLLNDAGQLVAQQDRPLAGDILQPMQDTNAIYGILLPTELPADAYRLIAGIYDPGQAGAPRIHTATGADFALLHEWPGLVQ
jgi:hypothetical protein